MNTIELGRKIAEIRRQKGITQEELAERASINVRTIQRIEKGDVDARSYTINEIAKALEIEPSLLLDTKTDDNRLWILLLHMTNYFPVMLLAIFIYTWKKDESPEIQEHGKKVLNFQITMFFLLIIAGFLSILVIGIIIAPILGILTWIYTTINIVRYLGGHEVKYPMSIQIIK